MSSSQVSHVSAADASYASTAEILASFSQATRDVLSKHVDTCDCKTVRKATVKIRNNNDRPLVTAMLGTQHAHILSDLVVHDGDLIFMTAGQSVASPHKDSFATKPIKVFRCPPAVVTFPVGDNQDLPLDPYFLGLWLGDGTAVRPEIASTDPETAAWLSAYVTRLNDARSPGQSTLELASYRQLEAGEYMPLIGVTANLDQYRHRIRVQPNTGDGINPVREGLIECGLLGDKSAGIPLIYRQGPPAVRAKVLAGLIDSDGYLDRNGCYTLSPATAEHENIILHAHEIAASLNIRVSAIADMPYRPPVTGQQRSGWRFYEHGEALAIIQPFIVIPRKKLGLQRRWYNRDIRHFSVEISNRVGRVREFEVEGHLFQHETRTILRDSSDL